MYELGCGALIVVQVDVDGVHDVGRHLSDELVDDLEEERLRDLLHVHLSMCFRACINAEP